MCYKLPNLKLVNTSDQSEFKKKKHSRMTTAPCPRQVSEKMIFGLSQSWESCILTLKSHLQRDQTCPCPCPAFPRTLAKPGRPKAEVVRSASAAGRLLASLCELPPASPGVGGPTCEAPLQPEGCCRATRGGCSPRVAGRNLPTQRRGTASINYSQVSWQGWGWGGGGGLLSDRCRFMQ